MRARRSRFRETMCLVVVGLAVGATAGSIAQAHSGCTVTESGGVQYWQGDEHDNTCNGESGPDDMNGYGAADTLHGGDGQDNIRGAYGNDSLYDGWGTDTDKFCDGADPDLVDMRDGDPNDHTHAIQDGATDIIIFDPNGADSSDDHSVCPF